VEAADVEGRTALHWVTKIRRAECLELLLKVCVMAECSACMHILAMSVLLRIYL